MWASWADHPGIEETPKCVHPGSGNRDQGTERLLYKGVAAPGTFPVLELETTYTTTLSDAMSHW